MVGSGKRRCRLRPAGLDTIQRLRDLLDRRGSERRSSARRQPSVSRPSAGARPFSSSPGAPRGACAKGAVPRGWSPEFLTHPVTRVQCEAQTSLTRPWSDACLPRGGRRRGESRACDKPRTGIARRRSHHEMGGRPAFDKREGPRVYTAGFARACGRRDTLPILRWGVSGAWLVRSCGRRDARPISRWGRHVVRRMRQLRARPSLAPILGHKTAHQHFGTAPMWDCYALWFWLCEQT